MFTNVFKSQTLNAGQTLSLSCTATGNPLPTGNLGLQIQTDSIVDLYYAANFVSRSLSNSIILLHSAN